MVDKYKCFTDFGWNDDERPEIQIHGHAAAVHVGGTHQIEIIAESNSDLKDQLAGYSEIFKAASESVDTDHEAEEIPIFEGTREQLNALGK